MSKEFKVKHGLIVSNNVSGSTVIDTQGTQGQLFSVTDDLTGDIFQVSDISGLPILNINADGTSTFDGDLIVSGNLIANISASSTLVNNDTTNNNRAIVFAQSTTPGSKTLYTDNGTSCYVNPNTNTIGATTLIASAKITGSGAMINGQIIGDTPPKYQYITGITYTNTDVPIFLPDVNVGTTASFLPFLHQKALHSGGYRTNMSLGLYKHTSGWGDGITGFYVGLGGSDTHPTQNYTLTYGGKITHSSGTIITDTFNATTGVFDNLSTNYTGSFERVDYNTTSTPTTYIPYASSLNVYVETGANYYISLGGSPSVSLVNGFDGATGEIVLIHNASSQGLTSIGGVGYTTKYSPSAPTAANLAASSGNVTIVTYEFRYSYCLISWKKHV